MRPDKLQRLVQSIRKFYPDNRVLVADDSPEPVECADCEMYRLPTNSGTSFGRNFLVNKVRSDYFLTCDDDFVFTEQTDIHKLSAHLDAHTDVSIAGGRVMDFGNALRPGPSNFVVKDGKHFRKFLPENGNLTKCEITSQFFAGRTSFFRSNNVRWDERLKVCADHIPFFWTFPGKVEVLSESGVL